MIRPDETEQRTAHEKVQSYRRGWRDATSGRLCDPKFLEHPTRPDLSKAYARGYAQGSTARIHADTSAHEYYGYVPDYFRGGRGSSREGADAMSILECTKCRTVYRADLRHECPPWLPCVAVDIKSPFAEALDEWRKVPGHAREDVIRRLLDWDEHGDCACADAARVLREAGAK